MKRAQSSEFRAESSEDIKESKILDLLRNEAISFWVDSSGGPNEYCNKSFIGTNPKYLIYGSLNEVFIEEQNGKKVKIKKNCFDFLEEKVKEEKRNKDGIFVGYLTYDLFQNSSALGPRPSALTTQPSALPPKADPPMAGSPFYPDFFFAYFDRIQSLNPEELKTHESKSINLTALQKLKTNMTNSEYLDKVKYIKNEIKEGNVYQANLTREYSLELEDADVLDLYRKLRNVSPNPYGCFFKTPFVTILSSSPEEFLYIEPASRTIRTRPIKGTMPKNVFEIDPKNKAENLMIVDLERNDLGKVCEVGSIKAVKLLEIETYQHLNHVVSTIEGKLKPDVSLRDIFEATFPGGSVTGAPKIAAMKIISEVEPTPRRGYTGSFGYIKTDRSMDFNILIRTIFVQKCHSEGVKRPKNLITLGDPSPSAQDDNLAIVTFNAGGGIVADSDPQEELEEIKLKARGILNTLGIKKL